MNYDFIRHKMYAFNVWDIETAIAIIDASVEEKQPIFIQISSKIFYRIHFQGFIYVIKKYITKVKANVIIHLDHSRDINQIVEAIDAGFDSVMYDGSNLNLQENIINTAKVVNLAKNKNVLVEGEIGQILGVEDDININEETPFSIQDVEKFVTSTGINLLAVAVGTSHGHYEKTPKINYEMIYKVSKISKIPFVVHGASGLSNEILKSLWNISNVKKINISTDVKLAYREGILTSKRLGLLDEIKFDATKVKCQIYESIKDLAISKLKVLKEI